jgi:hypothetical protein
MARAGRYALEFAIILASLAAFVAFVACVGLAL